MAHYDVVSAYDAADEQRIEVYQRCPGMPAGFQIRPGTSLKLFAMKVVSHYVQRMPKPLGDIYEAPVAFKFVEGI